MRIIRAIIIIIFLSTCGAAAARGVYQSPDAFIDEVFNGEPPQPRRLWLDPALKNDIRDVLEHDINVLRVRYWQKEGRTAWLLEEIGKEKPITTGIVVRDGQIERLRVLVFREVRGWEIRYPFFTDQFKGAALNERQRLDRPIDGISGATLSVRAMEKLARLALVLHRRAQAPAYGAQLSKAP